MNPVLLHGSRENQDVVDVNKHGAVQHVPEDIVDQGLENSGGVGESEGHDKVLEERFPNVLLHRLTLGPREIEQATPREGSPGKEVDGAVIRAVGGQGQSVGFAEHLPKVVVFLRNGE